jgi:hypothetical protein
MGQLRTLQSTKQRSIPRGQRSLDIEVFLLKKERDLFMGEAARIQKRFETVAERIKSIDQEIAQHELLMGKKPAPIPSKADKEWQTKKIGY